MDPLVIALPVSILVILIVAFRDGSRRMMPGQDR
jgi:hypothetical protein